MKNRIAQWIAYIMPPRVVYFCFIRFWAHATCTDEGGAMTPDDMKWTKAIELWHRTYGKF